MTLNQDLIGENVKCKIQLWSSEWKAIQERNNHDQGGNNLLTFLQSAKLN